jgi:superkiller protein 3
MTKTIMFIILELVESIGSLEVSCSSNLLKLLESYQIDKNYCQNHFLTSAKLNPQFASNFVYLGYFYDKTGDHSRAIQCYKKSISLGALEEEPGMLLGDEMERLGDFHSAIQLYQQITKKNIHAKWAWKRLAFSHLYRNEFEQSLTSFLSIIRDDPKDSKCWEGLGYVYEKQGKYLASLKAFNRAIELDPSLIHSSIEICNIHRILGNLSDSRFHYESLILEHPDHVMAYKGLSDTLFEISKNYFRDGIFVKCALELLKTQSLLRHCSKRIPNFEVIWKNLGDVNSYFYNLPEKSVKEALKLFYSTDLKDFYKNEKLDKFTCRMDFVVEGSKNYQKCLKWSPNDSDFWYDLGINFCYQYLITKSNNQQDQSFIQLASEMFKKSIFLNPNQSKYWNGLGFTQEDAHVKQHCFIRSIEKDSRVFFVYLNICRII